MRRREAAVATALQAAEKEWQILQGNIVGADDTEAEPGTLEAIEERDETDLDTQRTVQDTCMFGAPSGFIEDYICPIGASSQAVVIEADSLRSDEQEHLEGFLSARGFAGVSIGR